MEFPDESAMDDDTIYISLGSVTKAWLYAQNVLE